MNESLFSPSWYRVAQLRPRLRNHTRITRHVYRSRVSYVLEDRINGHVYRFSPETYKLIGLMTGDFTVQEIYDSITKNNSGEIPTQDQVIEILGQLHTMDALICDVPPDTNELLLRKKSQDQSQYLTQLKRSVLFLRLPLIDPDKFLSRYGHLFNFLFTKSFLYLLCGIFCYTTVQLALNWQDLTLNLLDSLFTRNNLILIWLIYPLVKTVHELAHAFAIKKWGGEVHEIGVMFLLLLPVPYVNATASSAFKNKWQRIAVSSAGILAEMLLAAIALLIWLKIEPGLVRSVAYNIIMIGGISTLLFNGNPLVRFDGYYVLSDLLELPNLAQRSHSYISYLFSRYFFGIKDIKEAAGSKEEKKYYLLYGPASFAYKLTIYGSIFYLLSSKFSVAGAIFGVLALGQLLLIPMFLQLRKLLISPGYRRHRGRILFTTLAGLSGLVIFLSSIPIPYYSQVEGVIWPPDDSIIRMETAGVIKRIFAPLNGYVKKGQILIECEDAQLDSNILLLQSQVREYTLKKKAAFAKDPFEATIIDERLKELGDHLTQKLEQRDKLSLRSPAEGKFIVPAYSQLLGKFIRQGDVLAYVLKSGNRVRTMIPQEDFDVISTRTKSVELVILSSSKTTYSGSILTETPKATLHLPTKVLATDGGGRILTDPEDKSGQKMLQEMFQVDIAIDTPIQNPFIGNRVLVRFQHGTEPLLGRLTRKFRQLFLAQFHA